MTPIDRLFRLHRAKSGLFSEYSSGDVAYVGNGLADNAVVGFVTPLKDDKVFQFKGIVISAFCEATVQAPPFVACGRAGNGLIALEPIEPMPVEQLAYIAAYINLSVQWRFNWYRQTTIDRIKQLAIPEKMPSGLKFDVPSAMPSKSSKRRGTWQLNLKLFALGDIYTLEPGYFHRVGHLPHGLTPVVSCGDHDNGVIGYYDIGNVSTDVNRITIAFNGENALTAKYHPYRFAAKDDVAVCHPKSPLEPTTELYIQTMVNRERWRYSYYRKCYADKLRRFQVSLPSKNGEIDEATIRAVVEASPYWDYVKSRAEAVAA